MQKKDLAIVFALDEECGYMSSHFVIVETEVAQVTYYKKYRIL